MAHEPRFCISITFEEDDWPPGVLKEDTIPATAASLTIDADRLLRGAQPTASSSSVSVWII